MAKILSIKGFKIHMEVPVFVMYFSFVFGEAVLTNLIIYRTCYLECGYNKTDCALLGGEIKHQSTLYLEELVEPYSTVNIVAPKFLEILVSGFICLFVGPWSDKFGRKPVLLFSMLGISIGHVFVTVLSNFDNLSPWYFLLPSVVMCLGGGSSCFATAVLSYISDVTSETERGLRMGLYQVISALAIFLGNFASSYVFYAMGYTTVFGISAFISWMGTMYIIFYIPESVKNKHESTIGPWKELFQFSHISDIQKTITKKRDNHGKWIINLCLVILSVQMMVHHGSNSVLFLFFRDKFHWSLRDFTMYNSFYTVITLIGCFVGVYFLHKFLRVTESILILTGYISIMNYSLLTGLARKNWHVYFAATLSGYSGILASMIQSLVSKTVNSKEIGKVFTFIMVISASFFGMLGLPLYTAIYNLTIHINPAMFHFVGVGFYVLNIIFTGIIIKLQGLKSQFAYNQLKCEEEAESYL